MHQKKSPATSDNSVSRSVPGLQSRDSRLVPGTTAEVRLFGKIRNELARLPHFLEHYRRLGVSRFFLIDNGSDDESVAFLMRQPDCHVFVTTQKMATARAGMDWIEPLLHRYGTESWCVVVDADELLVYDGAEHECLPAFCARLEAEGAGAMAAMMLDMYPRGTAIATDYKPGRPFLEACPYFDRSGYRLKPLPGGGFRAIGGPRLRVFYPDMLDWRLPARLSRAMRYRMARAPVLGRLATVRKLQPPYPPLLNKVPLVHWQPDFAFASAGHSLNGARFSAATGALLHFKFLGDFERRAQTEIARGAYENDGADYKRYVSGLRQDSGIDFTCALSEPYTGSAQLRSLGLIQPLPGNC